MTASVVAEIRSVFAQDEPSSPLQWAGYLASSAAEVLAVAAVLRHLPRAVALPIGVAVLYVCDAAYCSMQRKDGVS